MPADLPVIQVTDIRALQYALQALDRQRGQLGRLAANSRVVELVEVVERVPRDHLLLQLVRLYHRLRVPATGYRLADDDVQLVGLDYAGREAAHAPLALQGTRRDRRYWQLLRMESNTFNYRGGW